MIGNRALLMLQIATYFSCYLLQIRSCDSLFVCVCVCVCVRTNFKYIFWRERFRYRKGMNRLPERFKSQRLFILDAGTDPHIRSSCPDSSAVSRGMHSTDRVSGLFAFAATARNEASDYDLSIVCQ